MPLPQSIESRWAVSTLVESRDEHMHYYTERTLTAEAGPPPRDPYRQALTMRPSLKARPLVS